jgi:hypothetical protein
MGACSYVIWPIGASGNNRPPRYIVGQTSAAIRRWGSPVASHRPLVHNRALDRQRQVRIAIVRVSIHGPLPAIESRYGGIPVLRMLAASRHQTRSR